MITRTMTPEFAALVKRSKKSPTKIGRYGYDFAIVTLEELRMFLSITSELNPLIALDKFEEELKAL